MNNPNNTANTRWADTCDDMLLDNGPLTHLKSSMRQLAIKSLYIPLLCSQTIKSQNTPHLRIIFYHSIFDRDKNNFSEQLKFFCDNYRVLPLGDALIQAQKNQITEPTLSITFDDGYLNNLTVASELLAKHSIKGCFYVTSDFININHENSSDIEEFCRKRLFIGKPIHNMTWDDIKALLELGHEIGSHGISHKSLASLPHLDMLAEIQDSKSIIENKLNQTVRHFSVPFGTHAHYSQSIIDSVKNSGYESCVLGIRGPNSLYDNPYKLRRDHCSANWSIKEVRSHLMRSFLWPKPI